MTRAASEVEYSLRVLQAVEMAFELHRTQRRKGSGAPYITHLFAVAAIVGEYGGSEDQVIAALLHDAVEDQGGTTTLERIRHVFGAGVAQFVWLCSDAHTDPKPPWQLRKEEHIAVVAEAGPEVKLIVAADKLHNTLAILRDLRMEGADVWKRFKGGRDGSLWYLESMRRSLEKDWRHPILDELGRALETLRRTEGD